MKTIGSKLFISFLCMAALTVGLLWLIQAVVMKNSYQDSRTRTVAAAVRERALAGLPDPDALDALRQEQNINLLVMDGNGLVLNSLQGLSMMGRIIRASQAMIPDRMDGTVEVISSPSGTGRTALLGYPLTGGGYLVAIFSLTDVDAAALVLRSQLWLITLLLLVFALVLAIVLSRMFARPIRAVTAAARDLAGGRLNVVLPVQTQDEIGELTVALNELSVQLQTTENLRRELIANVSHELRAPLAVIQGYAETVRDVTWSYPEKRNSQLTIIAEEAERLGRVVKDILDFSKLQAGVEPINLADFAVGPALQVIQQRFELAAAAKSVQIELQGLEGWPGPASPLQSAKPAGPGQSTGVASQAETGCQSGPASPVLQIRFDPDKFAQVMQNLLQNAVNHADARTVITISLTGNPAAAICRIAVTNVGEPIPVAEQDRIWERYYRSTSIGENQRLGTGLGLAIVKSILERHHVAYGVVSENRRTTFWFETVART